MKQPAKCIPNQQARPVPRNHICSRCGDTIFPYAILGLIGANECLCVFSVMACQYQFEWAQVAITMHMLLVAGRAQHRSAPDDVILLIVETDEVNFLIVETRWKSYTALEVGVGVPQDSLLARAVKEECNAMSAAKEGEGDMYEQVGPCSTIKEVLWQGEADGDAVWRVHHWSEDGGSTKFFVKEANERRFLVVFAEAVDEPGVGEDAVPALTYGGCTGKRGWKRREMEEDLLEEVLVLQWRHGRGTEATHLSWDWEQANRLNAQCCLCLCQTSSSYTEIR